MKKIKRIIASASIALSPTALNAHFTDALPFALHIEAIPFTLEVEKIKFNVYLENTHEDVLNEYEVEVFPGITVNEFLILFWEMTLSASYEKPEGKTAIDVLTPSIIGIEIPGNTMLFDPESFSVTLSPDVTVKQN